MADCCQDCKRETETVFDHSTGDIICSECGLVLDSHALDETPEWRTFFDEPPVRDPNRVGLPIDPLHSDIPLSTTISVNVRENATSGKTKKDSSLTAAEGRWLSNAAVHAERGLLSAFDSITALADRLGLVTVIQDRAKDICKQLDRQRLLKVRNQDAIYAACIYIACRLENKPRTVKEISTVVGGGASKKEIGRAKEFILKGLHLELTEQSAAIHGADYMQRFGSLLGMSNRAVKAAQEAIQKVEEFDIRRSPVSLVAAVIYVIVQVSDDRKSFKEVAFVTQVAEGTIRNVYKDLHPHLSDIVPSWFATKVDIMRLLL